MLDRALPQRFVFHHVPKCGGTSVGRALRKRYLLSQATVVPESSFRAFEAFTGRSDRERMLVDVLDLREQMLLYLMYEDVRCISLHVRFSEVAYDRFRERYKFITILRDPAARFLSHYNWSFDKPNAHARIEEPLEEFLTTDRARQMGASYSEFFSGLPSDADFGSAEAIERAVLNLKKFSAVGRLDDLDGFRAQLRDRLGIRVRIGHENRGGKGRSSLTLSDLAPETKAEIQRICAPDIAVYERAFAGGMDVRA
nr:sulfotransferase family 2 domain-containing protein [Jannaschia seohaensis]